VSGGAGGAEGTLAVAVYGVAGAVGRDLVAQLDVDPEVRTIIGLDDGAGPADAAATPKLAYKRLGEVPSIESLFKEAKVKLAVYLAPFPAAASEAAIGRDDTDLARRFLNACEAAEVEGVVVASGATIYGARRDNPTLFVEGAPLKPGGLPPGELDLARERLCAQFARRRPQAALAVARLVPVVGPGTRGLMSRFLSAPRFMLVEGFDPGVQVVHVEDVSHAIFKLLKGRRTGAYNIAPDDTTTFLQLGRTFRKPLVRVSRRMALVRSWLTSLLGGAAIPPNLLPLLQYPILLANKKIKRETGYTFRYGCEAALAHHAKHAADQVAAKV
jgi:UDP-glucose 4-epimerase